MSKRSSGPGDYHTGYGRPPKSTQFKPGQSGNPKGRTKGSRSVAAIVKDVFHQKITVTENGQARRLPVLEVMLRRVANEAMRGDAKAIKLMLVLVDRYSDEAGATDQIPSLLDEDKAILMRYLQTPPEPVCDTTDAHGKEPDHDL